METAILKQDGEDSPVIDPLSLPRAGKKDETAKTGTAMLKQDGGDSHPNEGTKNAIYGSRLSNKFLPERDMTLTENVLSAPDSKEGLTSRDDNAPFTTGTGVSFSRNEEMSLKTEVREQVTIEKGGLLPGTHGENKQGNESVLSTQTLVPSSSIPLSHETEKGSLPSSPQTEPAQIYDQVGKQVLWSLKNNEEKIRLVLEPPELGNIYMEVKREKELVKATLWTNNTTTKEILESHQVQLEKILKADGFALEKFDVFFQQGTGWFQERREKPVDQGPWSQGEPDQKDNSRPTVSADAVSVQPSLFDRGSQYVDLFI